MTSPAEELADASQGFFEIANSPEFREDPYPFYALLRDSTPRLHTDFGLWFLSTHADISALLRDPHNSSDERHSNLYETFMEQARAEGRDMSVADIPTMLFMDPPDHTRLRGLVQQAFTPKIVEQIRPRAQELVDSMLDAVERRGDGTMDVVTDLAYPLPVTIICELLGVPIEDHERFSEWSRALTRGIDPSPLRTPEIDAAIAAAGAAFREYFVELVAERRRALGDDLLSALIAAEAEGEHLNEEELFGTALLLLAAGHETTVNLIGNGTLALLRTPSQRERLRNDPSLDRTAVDEFLRYDAPIQMTQRIALEPYELHDGSVVAPGEQMIAMLGAANRDPAAFAEPERLDVGRTESRRHLAFGGGIHHCLGAALARVEGEIAIASLVRKFPNMELAGEPTRRPNFTLRGLEHLPIAV